MEYYRKFDTIGLISLNDWYIIDFPLKNYDENGMEIQTNTSTSFLSGTTEEIRYSADGTPSRGMADIDVTLPENYRLHTDMLKKHLCPNCLKKVTDSLEYSKEANECIDAIPLCIVDFKTLEVYSLQKQWKSYFVRDYYVEVGSEEVLEALEEPLDVICEATHSVLEKTPPELAADVGEMGIVITGGGAYLRGLDKRIQERTGIRTVVAADADLCVARGTGESLKYIDIISRNSLNRRETYI